MSIIKPMSIEDHIITTLQKGPLPIVELIKNIQAKRPRTTKQGVYLTIRQLKKQEIVVVHKKSISLSSVWTSAMENFFALAKYNTRQTLSPGNAFLSLAQGEKLQYTFKNPILTDAFWSHVFLTLVEASSPKSPVLIYNPHEWFLLVREDNEMGLFNIIKDRKQQLAVLTGHNTLLDKSMKKHFNGTTSFYETLSKVIFEKDNYYVNVIADFVVEVWLDKNIMDQVNEFYSNTIKFGGNEKKKLEQILMQKGKNKFSITHNKRKADMLRKKFKKYFFLK